MKKILRLAALCLVLLAPFCSSRPKEQLHITKAEINLDVQAETLRASVCRRLEALEAVEVKAAPLQRRNTYIKPSSIEAPTCADAVHQ